MRIHIDPDICGQHGQCVIAAREIFRFAEDGSLEYVAEPDESLRELAEDAVAYCPNRAISLEG
jgi:ferredoxin